MKREHKAKPRLVTFKDTFLTLNNYKEPLKAIPESAGFGYYGAVLVSPDGEKMQCHICGELFKNVATHSHQAHGIFANEYREKYELSRHTALVSETERERMKQRSLKWYLSLTEDQKMAIREKAKKGLAKYFETKGSTEEWKERLESKNKKGTCPDQLLEKIKEVAKELGHTPSLSDFIRVTDGQRYKHLIFTTFGSWKKALEILKMKPKTKIERVGRRIYSNDELLEYLSLYARERNSMPTATDCRRGLLPSYEVYQRHFGSFPQARELAGVNEILNRD